MEYRNRSAGWKHAKLSGHKNEDLVKELLDSDEDFRQSFLKRINRTKETINKTSVGGIHETNVLGVLGRKTKSKTDLKVCLSSNEVVNVSLKKSLGGQVYLVDARSFIAVFENQFDAKIPADIQRAINLFWSAADDAVEIIKKFADKSNSRTYKLQLNHKSLNATTLKIYDNHLYDKLLGWFADNAHRLAKLSFSMGAVRDKNEWSDFVWYINLLEENDIDDIICIDDICNAVQKVAFQETHYGSRYGGTTIQLPFGFVQWHQGKLQFHHNYDKVKKLFR